MNERPSVSVVIVNWNHGSLIGECLDALLGQDYGHFDVTVVDNGSTDGSPGRIEQDYSEVRLHRLGDNLGFSRAFNYGASRTSGALLLSLNPDVIVRPAFMRTMAAAVSQDERIGMAAPKLVQAQAPRILDSTGLFIDRRRGPYDRGQGEADRGQYDARVEVFGPCGAAALYGRAMLRDLAVKGEYFDEDFFAYYEDADLAWRAHLRGWRCVYVPDAVATHARGWGDTLRRRGRAAKKAQGPRLALRNRYLMTVKNDAWRYFLIDLPHILGAEFPRLAYAAVAMPRVVLGIPDFFRLLPAALQKRKAVRARRTVEDAAIRRWFVRPGEVVAERSQRC